MPMRQELFIPAGHSLARVRIQRRPYVGAPAFDRWRRVLAEPDLTVAAAVAAIGLAVSISWLMQFAGTAETMALLS
jgi:hypothetical protein